MKKCDEMGEAVALCAALTTSITNGKKKRSSQQELLVR
jgi:hypothetical protein